MMKRTIPLLITSLSGFVLICAYFIPVTQSWGERVLIWFDIMAAIAFLLGGGNLLKVQLRKISDQRPGWGYSAVTVMTFAATLVIGLLKIGVQPAIIQEFRGESFAPLPVALLPEYSVPGTLPEKVNPIPLPASVREQMRVEDGRLIFRGWMRPGQMKDLMEWDSRLEWRANVELLAEAAQPPEALRGVLTYFEDHHALAFQGRMSDEQEAALRATLPEPAAAGAIDRLVATARVETVLPVDWSPPYLQIPATAAESVTDGALRVEGPLTPDDRKRLERRWAGFPLARRLDQLEQLGVVGALGQLGRALDTEQIEALKRILALGFTSAELRDVLNTAGQAQASPKTYVELLAERNAGETDLDPKQPAGESVVVNAAQFAELDRFAFEPEFTPDALIEALRAAGPLTVRQEEALRSTIDALPTEAERNYQLAIELLKTGRLSERQVNFLLDEYRHERGWRQSVAVLAARSNPVKYAWSGQYDQQGSWFWYIYEFILAPLKATMFALLAFYVASAAFRAFRAKNFEAILLLGTAFIILLGRTFAGVWLTSWLPPALSGLRIENLSVVIMSVFNTAGNRAIMIGIALGLAATSLRLLLGVDRSHLGGDD